MIDRTTSRRRRPAFWGSAAAVFALVLSLASSAFAQWLPATGDGVDLWIVRPTREEEAGIRILHRRDLEEPTNRIFRVGTLSGRVAPAGLASAGERLWIVYDNLNVQSLPVTITDSVDHERYGEPRPETPLPKQSKLWSLTANQDGPWALVRIDSEQALAALKAPKEVAQTEPTTTPTTMPATSPATAPAAAPPSLLGPTAPTAAMTQPFKPVDALLRLKRNRWTIESLPEDWISDARNFVLMLRATQADPVLVSLRPDTSRGPNSTLAVVYRRTPDGWHKRVYSLPGGDENAPAPLAAPGSELTPLAIDGQLVIASLSFNPSPKTASAATRPAASATTQPTTAPAGTLVLNMAILGDSVSSITPLVLAQNKPASFAMVPVRQTLAIIFLDDAGALTWGIVDLHGRLESAFAALTPRDERVLSEQSVWLVPVLLLAAAVLIMFARMRKDSPAAVPQFPEGFVAADILRRVLAFCFDLAPCVLLTSVIFGIDAPVLVGQWAHFNVGWDVMLPRIVVVMLFALHTGISEAVSGKTLGKSILGLKVISTSGGPPTLGQTVVRNVLKIFDLIAWPLLFLPLMRPYAQRLGDLAAKTVVVMPEPTEDEDDDEEV